ncbi:MAG: phosphoglucosamine mutase [Bacteroidales bacterium]|nr:phosphoglucosamine mutase [Bacteroidales bacterium]
MTLIKSISGIRGTIGGTLGENLTPIDIVKFIYAYSVQLKARTQKAKNTVVVGRDARLSGEMVENMVCGTLLACGIDVINAGLCSTPTTEMAVILSKADGGIILTASHNPRQWNALKLLNEKGEFLSAAQGKEILDIAEKNDFEFAAVDELGTMSFHDFTEEHIDKALELDMVDVELVRKAGFKVVVDAINSVGGIIIPKVLERLGVECIKIHCDPTGDFAHNPEPLPCNLTDLSKAVVENGADLGISVDPDVDRLAFICENGEPFGEEYTLVSIADYILGEARKRGVSNLATSSNLSSSRALRDVTEAHGGTYHAAAVGEVNVTTKMRECGAIIGGEGNGGVIYPALHYGRDAIVGSALFLSLLAKKNIRVSSLRDSYPQYYIAKNKIELSDKALIDRILSELQKIYASEDVNTIDGVKISFEKTRSWVHLRKSNTEPIIRIYAEAPLKAEAEALAEEIISVAKKIIG